MNIKTVLYKILKYIFGIYALDHAPDIAHKHGLKQALVFLKKAYPFFTPTLVKFLQALYQYLLSLETDTLKLSTTKNKKNLIIHFCCWDDAYCDKAINAFFPSLLANDNIPFSAEKYQVTLLIACDNKSREILMNCPAMTNLKQYCNIQTMIIPEHLLNLYDRCLNQKKSLSIKKIVIVNSGIKYLLLGGLQTHAFKLALQKKAIISFLMPDCILSDTFLKAAFDLIQDKCVVLATSFRTFYPDLKKDLAPYFNDSQYQLSIPALSLAYLKLKHLHPAAKRQIVSEITQGFLPCAQLLFKAQNGITMRAFHYHPILLDCERINHRVAVDYYPIDNSVLNHILDENIPYNQQISVCSDSSMLEIAELSDDRISQNYTTSTKQLSRQELITCIKTMVYSNPAIYNTPLNQYLVSQRYQLQSDQIVFDQQDCVDDVHFLKSVFEGN